MSRTLLAAGQRLGPYRIVASLAAGGMGEVYRAHDPRLGREVAIKVLLRRDREDPALRARFEREARAIAALGHPNVLTVHDVGEQDGVDYMVTELLRGETLRVLVSRDGPLDWPRVVELGVALARGTAAAHASGVVHRDLKPENIFRTHDGTWKILDFGLARMQLGESGGEPLERAETELTEAGALLGTTPYMSPEQARGEEVDGRTDLFSLGVVLYEALSGKSPFRRDSPAETVGALLHEPAPPTPTGVAAPAELQRLLDRCLAKRREDRLASAEELGRALESIRQGTETERPTPPSLPSIAVLPFVDMSRSRDQGYFCEGIAEEILHSLTRAVGLRVAARSSSFQFDAGAHDVREVAEKLEVGHVLEGSVRREGERLRVTVQLIDAATGFRVWSERFDRGCEDVFAIQEEIAASVAGQLSSALSDGLRSALRRRGTRDLAAYDRYLRARRLVNEHRQRSFEKATLEYRAALEADPEFAAAWAALAICRTWFHLWWHGHDPEALAEAERASAHASELDPEGPETLAARGWVLSVAGRFVEADAAFERALAAAPERYETLYQFARLRFVEGRYPEAAELFERGAVVDPDEYQCLSLVVMCYQHLEDPERALDAARRTVARVERRIDLAPGDARAYYLGAGAAVTIGDVERGRAWIGRALDLDPHESPTLYNVACVLARLGDLEPALDLLERAVHSGFGHRAWFENDTDLEALHGQPRFAALLESMS